MTDPNQRDHAPIRPAPALPDVDSPPPEEVLEAVPSTDEIIDTAQSAEEILEQQPGVDELVRRRV
jgi:hypothetical protein